MEEFIQQKYFELRRLKEKHDPETPAQHHRWIEPNVKEKRAIKLTILDDYRPDGS